MKIKGVFVLLTGMLIFCCFEMHGQSSDSRINQEWNIHLIGGVQFKDQSGLSKLLFNDDGNGFSSNLYTYVGGGLKIDWNRVLISVDGKRGTFNENVANGNQVEVKDNTGQLAVGYNLFIEKRIKLAPIVGILVSQSEINYTQNSPNPPSSVSGLLAGAPNTWLLKAQNYYASAGVDFSFNTGEGQHYKFVPLELGVKAEYLHRLSDTDWKSGLDSKIEGPNVFDSSFYIGISIGWWII